MGRRTKCVSENFRQIKNHSRFDFSKQVYREHYERRHDLELLLHSLEKNTAIAVFQSEIRDAILYQHR